MVYLDDEHAEREPHTRQYREHNELAQVAVKENQLANDQLEQIYR